MMPDVTYKDGGGNEAGFHGALGGRLQREVGIFSEGAFLIPVGGTILLAAVIATVIL